MPLFCSYHILTSSVIYYWTDARQHGIYLLNSTGVPRQSPIQSLHIPHPTAHNFNGHMFSSRASCVLAWIFQGISLFFLVSNSILLCLPPAEIINNKIFMPLAEGFLPVEYPYWNYLQCLHLTPTKRILWQWSQAKLAKKVFCENLNKKNHNKNRSFCKESKPVFYSWEPGWRRGKGNRFLLIKPGFDSGLDRSR